MRKTQFKKNAHSEAMCRKGFSPKVLTLFVLCFCLLLFSVPSFAQDSTARFGPFDAEKLNGEGTVSDAIFADAEITLVNLWATWCGACIDELPDLQELDELTDGKVQVVGILLDAYGADDKRDESAIDAMHVLLEKAGVTYSIVMPDEFLKKASSLASAIPTTFVIDKNGVVREAVVGSRSAKEWIQIAQKVADSVYENAVTLAK